MYLEDGPALAVVASNLGSDRPPAWWLNLQARPEAHVRLGPEVRRVRAREATADERAALWPRFVELYSDYAVYERSTDRPIPIVLLEAA
jgi:deazaflavin-dependent oxidoreductase (nitroreductase family)